MGTYTDIIERLEKATGPSAPLTASILEATGLYVRERRGKDRKEWLYPTFKDYGRIDPEFPADGHVTASLDASIALVERMLPGNYRGISGPRKYLNIPSPVPDKFLAEITTDSGFNGRTFRGWGPTECLALLIAMFRALEHQEANHAD